MKYLSTLLVLALTVDAPLRIRVSPQVVMAGGSVTVICSVPRQTDNRSIEAILNPYRASMRDLEGENAAITHRFEFSRIPCEVTEAVCRLTTNAGKSYIARQGLLVSGCDP